MGGGAWSLVSWAVVQLDVDGAPWGVCSLSVSCRHGVDCEVGFLARVTNFEKANLFSQPRCPGETGCGR